MPVRAQAPHKKRKVEVSSKQTYKYVSVSEIRPVFEAQSESGLIEGLTALRNQLTIKSNEPHVQVNDNRLLLAKAWLDEDPGAQDLFSVWEGTNARQHSLLSVIVGLFSALLTLLSAHYTYHAQAQPILRALLSQQWTQHLNTYLGGQHSELVLVTLKLFNALSNFAGGRERRAVLDAFAWEIKSLPKLLNMRRRSKTGEDVDMLARPDIRTLYTLLVLSFVDSTTPLPVKAAFLEQHRDAFTSVFKGLWQDPHSVIRRVLEVCWSGLWSDAKLKRTLKIQVFNEATLSQLVRIYERNNAESDDAESVPADVVHHFLLALCSRPGVGLCFHDRGWYPRETESDRYGIAHAEDGPSKGGKVYNKILANVLKGLKVNEDTRQQELALKILAACPELVSGYWSSCGLALEPRLSSKWLANIAFLGMAVSLPVPSASFVLPESGSGSASLYHPTPPPLSTIVDNILPTSHTKTHLSRGLQAASPLVQHASALALAKCLLKYEQVVSAFEVVERALEEDEEEGLWARRRREVEREVRKRVPDFQVIVGFSQRLDDSNSPAGEGHGKEKEKTTTPNSTRTALLAESGHRLLWLYHRLLPSIVAEARFDAGKLLQAIEDMFLQSSTATSTAGLGTLRQLHVLRLLQECEYFTWSGRSGSKHSNFHVLLKAYITTPVPAVRTAIVALLRHILAPGVLFQHDPDEISLWLDSLPLTRRAPGAQTPDGAPLTDEGDSVIPFLDECVQRCVKTPYKYVEELQAVYTAHDPVSSSMNVDTDDAQQHAASIGQRPEAFPSPLLATVIEQLGAKLRAKLLSFSDTLALLSFVRKLLLRMASKSTNLVLCKAFSEKVAALVEGQALLAQHATREAAVRREVVLLTTSITQLQTPATVSDQNTTGGVQDYLTRVEQSPDPDSDAARQIAAYELVDWVRLTSPLLGTPQLERLISAIERLYKPALRELFQYLEPRQVSLWWKGANIVSDRSRLWQEFNFDTLCLHCTNELLQEEACRTILLESLFPHSPDGVVIKRAIRLILHRLTAAAVGAETDCTVRDWLLVLAGIIQNVQGCGTVDASDIALFCFESETLKSLCARPLSQGLRDGLSELLDTTFQIGGEDILQLFTRLTGRWVLALRESLNNIDDVQRATASIWFRYLNAREALGLLDYLADRVEHSSADAVQEIIGAVLAATSDAISHALEATPQALPLLRRLQSLVPQSSELLALVATGTRNCLPLCYDGTLPDRPFPDWNVASLIPASDKRWALRLQPVPPLAVDQFLSGDDSAVEIAANLLYRQASARSLVADWLRSPSANDCITANLVKITFALYDSSRVDGIFDYSEALEPLFLRFAQALQDAHHPPPVRSMIVDCVVWIVASSPFHRYKYLKSLIKDVTSTIPDKLSPSSLLVGEKLHEEIGAEVVPLAEELLDMGLIWAVRYFADHVTSTADSITMLKSISALIQKKISVKHHLAEPVILAIFQDGLGNIEGLQLIRLLASSMHMKPATVNKYLQTVVQHAKFYDHCAISSSDNDRSPREAIVDLLHMLFYLHPTNTCQPSHIDPLRRVYGGTLGAADLKILSILRLFESTRRTPVTSLLSQWSTSPDVPSASALEAIQGLEPSRVLKTCLDYPDWRKMDTALDEELAQPNVLAYDPVFTLLLFAQLFRTNIISLMLRTLSTKDAQLRELAWSLTAALYRALENADLQEQPHVLHILKMLKDIPPSAPSEEPTRLPAYTTLLLAHAFRGIFYPSNFIYPLTARFLLQRPSLDPSDVPMLYGMLYSSSDEWKKERAWIVRFLADGIIGNEERKILKRRHTWDLLASLFQSEGRDRTLRRSVLEVLANITCNARATASLILRHALLSWIEMQLHNMHAEEAVAWVRILENILAVVQASKIESATDGEWRSTIARSLQTILHHPSCTLGVFGASVPVQLRLCLLPGRSTSHVPALLTRSLHWLTQMEAEVAIPASGHYLPPFKPLPSTKTCVTLHRSQHLHDSPPAPSIEGWGECVESLWRISMSDSDRTAEWDKLTSRLLIWRAIAGADGSQVGEWGRREVVKSLQSQA